MFENINIPKFLVWFAAICNALTMVLFWGVHQELSEINKFLKEHFGKKKQE